MAYIKKLRGRNVSGVVTAYGEVLFMPGGPVNSWTNRFAARVGAETRRAAPTNKRPRWAHYGKPLKATITASRPEFSKTSGGARLHAAVGSTAPYAYYVDQGTGIHGGNGPYEAKIIPPWLPVFDLYDHNWRPSGPDGPRVGKVMIKGQRGQGFFEAGLQRGFARMRMRSFQVPGDGVAAMSEALGSFPRGLEYDGKTPGGPGFVAQLTAWREARDERWQRDGSLGARANRRADDPERMANIRAYQSTKAAAKKRRTDQVKSIAKTNVDKSEAAKRRKEAEEKARASEALRKGNARTKREAVAFFAKIKQAYPDVRYSETKLADGVILYTVSYNAGGQTIRQKWAYGYAT